MSNILLGVTGGIAAYKSVYLARLFISHGHKVRVIMTKNAEEFVGSLTFEAITDEPVFRPDNRPSYISHIEWAKWADICIIAPATANIIGKLRSGIADDPLSTTIMALNIPILIAPAMNSRMLDSPQVKENIKVLVNREVSIINSEKGVLACKDVGKGRMADPEKIFAAAESMLFCHNKKIMSTKKVLVTCGATREFIDPVRYISNMSSGKMGIAIAEAALAAGAKVTLIKGETKTSSFIEDTVNVSNASEMTEAILNKSNEYDIIIMAAAVADYHPMYYSDQKIKKSDNKMILELEKNTDILKELGKNKKNHQILAGFAAESQNIDFNAESKLQSKNLDIIVANDITKKGIGFDSDDNEVKIFFKDGRNIEIKKMSKREIAAEIIYILGTMQN